MPFIVGIIGIIVAAYFWSLRAQRAAEVARVLIEIPGDIKAAARRFGFKRRMNVHPVDSVEEPNLALAGIANSFIELSVLPTQEQRQNLLLKLQSFLDVSHKEAEEYIVLGRWLASESGGPEAGIYKLSNRLKKIAGVEGFQDLMKFLKILLGDTWSQDQIAALNDVKNAFRIS